jgi:uncharacterized membrane protein YqiK
MAESQKSMVSIVAIVAIVILVGIVIWFMRERQSDGLHIEIGAESAEVALPGSTPTLPL